MAQHFLLSAASRSLSIAQVLRLSDAEAEAMFAGIRWASTEGKPVCPECGCYVCYECRAGVHIITHKGTGRSCGGLLVGL